MADKEKIPQIINRVRDIVTRTPSLEQRAASYLESLTETDRANVGQILDVVRQASQKFDATKVAVEAVGSSTQPENKRLFGPVDDIDLRILTSPEPDTVERRHAVSTLREAIRAYLTENGIHFQEEDYTTSHRMVYATTRDRRTGKETKILSPFLDYNNGDPSFSIRPQNGLPLHVFISGNDNYSLEEHLQAEQRQKTSAVVLFRS
jgi:hypothetical protein